MLSNLVNFNNEKYSLLNKEKKREFVLNYMLDSSKKLGRLLELSELSILGLTRQTLRETWISLGNIHNRKEFSDLGIVTMNDFSELKRARTKREIAKHNRFCVVTVETNRKVPKERLKSLENYCRRQKAMILIFVVGKNKLMIDPIVKDHHFITEKIELTKNLELIPINNTSGQSIAESVAKYTKHSLIVPHYTLSKVPIPTGPGKQPRLAMSTGTISNDQPLFSDKLDDMLKNEFMKNIRHEISMFIIETSGDFFFERPVMFDTDGSFIDLTKTGFMRFSPNGKISKETPEWLHLGDWHSGETSIVAKRNHHALAVLVRPKIVIFNDMYSHLGPSHHNENDPIAQYHLSQTPALTPESEFKILANDMKEWHNLKGLNKTQFIVVESNHDDHLAKSVKKGIMDKHPALLKIKSEITLALIKGERLTEWGLKQYANFSSKRMKFLGRNEEFSILSSNGKIYGHLHGDIGNRGAKNSTSAASGLSLSTGCAIVGHTHEPRIIPGISNCGRGNGGVWYSGTSTCVDGPNMPHYAQNSANAWLITSTLVFKGKGRILRTHITVVGGIIGIDFGKPVERLDNNTYNAMFKGRKIA